MGEPPRAQQRPEWLVTHGPRSGRHCGAQCGMDQDMTDPNIALRERLITAGLRPTSKRLALGGLVLNGANRHFSAEQMWNDAQSAGIRVSLATVYNTLRAFVDSSLLQVVQLQRSDVFDTNTHPHHHVLDETTGQLTDLEDAAVTLTLDEGFLPPGATVQDVDIVVRVRS